jgi:hypothetical protein
MPRTIDTCSKCGEEKEIVSHGRCAKCNMQDQRAAAQRAAKSSNKVRGLRIMATLNANIQDALDFEKNLTPKEREFLVATQTGVRALLRQWASDEQAEGAPIESSEPSISQGPAAERQNGSNAPLPS